MQLQRLPRVVSISVSSPGYPYLPYLPGESQGGDAQSSSPIESSRRCDDFKFEFGYFSLTDFSPASTILKVIVLRVALCNMRKKSVNVGFLNPPSHMGATSTTDLEPLSDHGAPPQVRRIAAAHVAPPRASRHFSARHT